MKIFTITKLDKRHTGYRQFTHYINPIYQSQLSDKLQFLEWRKWCWECFGPGMERDFATELGREQFEVCRWAWYTLDRSKRLYFASEKELSQFCLKWA
jgi:hypothetical protein